MFALIGFAFSLLFGTTKFALRNVVRFAALSLVGYFFYQLIAGYSQGRTATAKATGKASAGPQTPPPPAANSANSANPAARESSGSPLNSPMPPIVPAHAAAVTPATKAAIVGAGDHRGQSVHVSDAGGVEHEARVGRGVVRR